MALRPKDQRTERFESKRLRERLRVREKAKKKRSKIKVKVVGGRIQYARKKTEGFLKGKYFFWLVE